MLNSVIMTGRMVADPELITKPDFYDSFKCRAGECTDSCCIGWEIDIDVVAWRNTAEFAAKHFKKGDSLTVQGRAEVRKFTDKDGNNRETVEIIADSVYFGEKKRDTSEQNTAPVPDDFEPIEDEFPDFPG